MSNAGLLVVTNPAKLGHMLQIVQSRVHKALYIQLESMESRGIACVSRLVSGVYSQASALCHKLDVRLLIKPLNQDVDIVFYDGQNSSLESFRCSKEKLELSLDDHPLSAKFLKLANEATSLETDKQFAHVVLGGTFDRLHIGHKELLSQAIIRCKRKLTVGVTDANMLSSKILNELIEPCDVRIEKVKEFLMDVDNTLEYAVVPISDPFGPTKDDPTMDLIVVSDETLKGGLKVNEVRAGKGLAPLQLHCVQLVEDLVPSHLRDLDTEDWKISSSSARMRLLGTLLKKPDPRPNIPSSPHLIGLTGGIASGKSKIGERLEKKGCGVINCDLIGHQVYEPGTKGLQILVDEFGKDILDDEGKVNRRALGKIVFGSKERLEKLNSIVWPLMLEIVQQKIKEFKRMGCQVVVLEAAVLARAGWHLKCHEVWSVIVPQAEAIKRLQERDNLSEEDSKARCAAQPPNSDHVRLANIVFSPSWSPEHTDKQVERAWAQLQSRLSSSSRL
ncbi:bifunctional coenzyme A synthase [Neocloeon triangulifer]|uniref:bifunctional coenzyme A synthase n=1 Tax=Neocloeon triangulifer TaxID=2078957 RepID=UPI00286ECA43|nr:bifunctional coenzyme A synthase [Neocloeon triangulifer]